MNILHREIKKIEGFLENVSQFNLLKLMDHPIYQYHAFGTEVLYYYRQLIEDFVEERDIKTQIYEKLVQNLTQDIDLSLNISQDNNLDLKESVAINRIYLTTLVSKHGLSEPYFTVLDVLNLQKNHLSQSHFQLDNYHKDYENRHQSVQERLLKKFQERFSQKK